MELSCLDCPWQGTEVYDAAAHSYATGHSTKVNDDRPRKPTDKFRVHRSPGYNGQWVVQKWYPDMKIWADMGDPCTDYNDANSKLQSILQGTW